MIQLVHLGLLSPEMRLGPGQHLDYFPMKVNLDLASRIQLGGLEVLGSAG
jgi:hypothetical protein